MTAEWGEPRSLGFFRFVKSGKKGGCDSPHFLIVFIFLSFGGIDLFSAETMM